MLPVIRGHLRNSLLLTCGVLLAALVWYLVGLDSGSPPSDRDGGVPLEALDEVAEQAELGPGSALEAAAEQRAPARTEIESAPAAPVRPDRRVSISGRTIDDGGVAVSGVRVRLHSPSLPGPLEVFGDGAGRFVLDAPHGIQGSGMRLELSAPGWADFELAMAGRPALERELGDLVLERGFNVGGRVVSADGLPIEGAKLFAGEPGASISGFALGQLVRDGRPLAVTDGGGRFRLGSRARGPLRVHVQHEGFLTKSLDRTIVSGDEDWRIELVSGKRLAGQALGLPEGGLFGVQAVAVGRDAEPRTALVGATGGFELGGLLDTVTYRCSLYAADSESASAGSPGRGQVGLAREPVSDSVDASWKEGPIQLSYSGLRRVVLVALAAPEGQPVVGLEAVLRTGPNAFGRTLAGGGVESRPGGYEFLVPGNWDQGFGSRELELGLFHPDFLEQRIELPSEPWAGALDLGDLRFEPAPRCRLTVVDAVTGVGLPGAEVRWDYGDGVRRPAVRTDAAGQVGFVVQPGAAFDLTVLRAGFAPYTRQGLRHLGGQPGGEEMELEVALGRGSAVEVQVVRFDGTPVEGRRVTMARVDQATPVESAMRTDESGICQATQIPAGRYRFGVSSETEVPSEANTVSEVVDLDGVNARSIRLQLPQGVRLFGVVLLGGKPLGGAGVQARVIDPQLESSPSVPLAPTQTGEDGTFELELEFPRGAAELTVRHRSLAAPHRERVPLDSPRIDVEIRIANTRLTGRVVDDRGLPVGGARVTALVADGAGPSRFPLEGSGSQVLGSDGGGTVTDGDGRFELHGLPAEEAFFVVARPGAERSNLTPARSEALRLEPNGIRQGLVLALRKGGTLRVEPQDGSGQPVVACFVTATPPVGAGEVQQQAYVGSEGWLELVALVPGTWAVQIQRLGSGETLETSVEISPGETQAWTPRFRD